MEDKLIELLGTFGYLVKRQGSISSPKDYPDSFFTYWNNSSEDASHYDNKPAGYVWDFDVNFYSTDVALVYSKQGEAIDLLKSNGFIVPGRGYDIPSDTQSHIGRGVNVLYVERIN